MRDVLKRFVAFIGPHPYHPPALFVFFWIFYVSRYVPLMLAEPSGLPRLRAAITIFLLALIPATALAGLAALWDRFRPWPQNKLGFYLLEILLSVWPMNLAFEFLKQNPYFETIKGLRGTTAPPTPILLAFNFAFAVLLLAVINSREGVIKSRLDKAADLVRKLEKDSRLLVLAESEFKDQVSHFLHDRVQSNLMVASMRLQKMVETPSQLSTDELRTIIHDLEKLRMEDLRLAIESLAPNLAANDLSDLIRQLVPKSLSNSTLEVRLAQASELFNDELKMAIFKICEQAILNALMHGSAQAIEVSLRETSDGSWQLVILDDGKTPLSDEVKPGLGTAIIDSWVRIIDGTKNTDTHGGNGYTLEVSFKPQH